jgi:hypothetical protein
LLAIVCLPFHGHRCQVVVAARSSIWTAVIVSKSARLPRRSDEKRYLTEDDMSSESADKAVLAAFDTMSDAWAERRPMLRVARPCLDNQSDVEM